jgi:hypothetical protein
VNLDDKEEVTPVRNPLTWVTEELDPASFGAMYVRGYSWCSRAVNKDNDERFSNAKY